MTRQRLEPPGNHEPLAAFGVDLDERGCVSGGERLVQACGSNLEHCDVAHRGARAVVETAEGICRLDLDEARPPGRVAERDLVDCHLWKGQPQRRRVVRERLEGVMDPAWGGCD